ncbi:MAG: OmpA family protein, partial [Muribaculaceae bacterium]|nr:OmpA family protein [Muribaculaceae bacterium]
MKKIILMAALAVGAMAANAQTTVEGSKFSDNWSITLKGGAVSPVKPAGGFFEQARGIFGLELRKQITPVFGLGV